MMYAEGMVHVLIKDGTRYGEVLDEKWLKEDDDLLVMPRENPVSIHVVAVEPYPKVSDVTD